jgi:hypothetical protein
MSQVFFRRICIRPLAAMLPAILAGCNALTPVRPEQEAFLNGLRGHPITDLTAKLGPPSSQQIVGSEHWYIWNTSYMTTLFGPQPMQAQCKLSVNTDATDQVRTWRWEGNVAGCQALFRPIQ